MPAPATAPPALHQLCFVLADGAPLLRFIPGVTMEDIARLLREVSAEHQPVGVSVTLVERFRPSR